ncbi:MAG: SRPBCC domain-containing protein [Nitrospirota bacterium]
MLVRVFAAPRERVWKAMPHPEHVAHWWGPNGFTTTVKEYGAIEGGKQTLQRLADYLLRMDT